MSAMSSHDSAMLDRPWPQISLGIICAVGLTISGELLFIATYDFYRLVHRPLGVAMAVVMLVLFSAAARAVTDIFHPDFRKPASSPPWVRETLIAAVPLALLSSRLSCMGLGLVGCSTMCNFLASA